MYISPKYMLSRRVERCGTFLLIREPAGQSKLVWTVPCAPVINQDCCNIRTHRSALLPYVSASPFLVAKRGRAGYRAPLRTYSKEQRPGRI